MTAVQSSLEQRVSEWLDQQGYPLEMRVASSMRQSGFEVRQGVHYQDRETGKPREIDVVSFVSDPLGLASIQFFVECKSGKKPWLLLTSESTLEGYNLFFALGLLSKAARTCLIRGREKLISMDWFRKPGRIGYGVRQAFTDNTDAAHAATYNALKACSASLLEAEAESSPRRFACAFPVVVVQAPLLECFLNSDGGIAIKEVDSGFLLFDPIIPGCSGTCLKVVSDAGLGGFSREADEMSKKLLDILKPEAEQEWNRVYGSE